MLRKIVDFVKKIFWAEPMPAMANTLRELTVKPVKFARICNIPQWTGSKSENVGSNGL